MPRLPAALPLAAAWLAACAAAPPHPRAVEQVRRGYAHLAAGDRERAEVAFEHALEMAPDLGEARAGLGVALRAAGRAREALAQFDAAVAADSDLAEAHGGRAAALAALGDDRAAGEAVDDALRIDPDQVAPRILRARILARNAVSAAPAERAALLDRARRDLLHAAEARPRLPLVHLELGWVSWLQGHVLRAAESYARAAALDPSSAEAWLGSCAALRAAGREADANAACRRCRREAGERTTAAVRCAAVLDAIGAIGAGKQEGGNEKGAPASAGAPR